MTEFRNPFRPGAGHQPPYLAGREEEKSGFKRLLEQETILENMVLTGLRGVGKTVLLEELKPLAVQSGWRWVGTDLSESSSVSEDHLALRLCTDLSPVTSPAEIEVERSLSPGLASQEQIKYQKVDYEMLTGLYSQAPGLVLDKIKTVLETAWAAVSSADPGVRGIIFAYDEAQNLADHPQKEQFPLALLLDAFQSLQRKNLPLMLVLAGLPTLFPKLVNARTFAERMFRVVFLQRLSDEDSRKAIRKPLEEAGCPVKLTAQSVDTIVTMSGKYPYFIQFICKEVYDAFIQRTDKGRNSSVPVEEIARKLDSDFFAGRWARATDRQRALIFVAASLERGDGEFTVQELVEKAKEVLDSPFGSSHANQTLARLIDQGLIFKKRHGRYLFAVPLMGEYILRRHRGVAD